jgi:hypothetical protein
VARLASGLGLLLTLGGCSMVFGLDEPMRVPDGAVDSRTDPAKDTDGDSIPDVSDRCPTLADNQHDEDGDGIGDRCDDCPLHANPQGEDGDNDGLGDACDVRQDLFDCTAYIGGFASLDGWTSRAGTWDVVDDDLVVDATNSSALLVSTASYTRPYVTLRASFVERGGGITSSVGVWGIAFVGAGEQVSNGALADVSDTTTASARLEITRVLDSTATTLTSDAFEPMAELTSETDMIVTINLFSALSAVASIGTSMAVGDPGAQPVNGQAPIAIRVYNASARIHNVWVITSGTNSCPPPAQ